MTTIKEALESYFGKQFPELLKYTEMDYINSFHCTDNYPVKMLDLTQTKRIANHFREDHINFVEALINRYLR